MSGSMDDTDNYIEEYDMKRILIASCILFTAACNAEGNAFPEIERSDAALLLPAVKLFETDKLKEGAEVAQRVLEQQEQASFLSAISSKEWAFGIIGAALSYVITKSVLGAGAEQPGFIDGMVFVIGVNLIYGYWYMGQKLRLDRAKLVAAAFDRELAKREREAAAKR